MAQHESIDLTTLEEVHRLLRETEFATVDDLTARGTTIERVTAPAAAAVDGAGPEPLPRRR